MMTYNTEVMDIGAFYHLVDFENYFNIWLNVCVKEKGQCCCHNRNRNGTCLNAGFGTL